MIKHYSAAIIFSSDKKHIWLKNYDKRLFGFMLEIEPEESPEQTAQLATVSQSGIIINKLYKVTDIHCMIDDNPAVIHLFSIDSNQVPTKSVYRYDVSDIKKLDILNNLHDALEYALIKVISPHCIVPKMVFVK